tara:strand:+ start:1461 stop:2360 length:900 start_codon:yes stop_codon:yes gene_type:complete
MPKNPKLKNKLEALSINEELGDIPTHFWKSGSSMRPISQLNELNKFKHRLIPSSHRKAPFEYDLWFNTNELHTIRSWLYTDFLGKGIYVRVNSVKINDRLMEQIASSDIKIDEERIENIKQHLDNKYSLQWNTEFHNKVIFPPGSNLMNKNVINWHKVTELVEKGYKIKPHPITAHLWIAKMKGDFGEENILNKKEGGFELLLNCEEMAMCPNSEMGLIALLLGKKVNSVATPRKVREKAHLTYEAIYRAVANQPQGSGIALQKILSSKRSGMIFNFDPDPEERLDRYLDNFWEYTIAR